MRNKKPPFEITNAMIDHHILVWSPSLPVDQRHHLMDWFKFKKDSKNILIQNMRLK